MALNRESTGCLDAEDWLEKRNALEEKSFVGFSNYKSLEQTQTCGLVCRGRDCVPGIQAGDYEIENRAPGRFGAHHVIISSSLCVMTR